MFIQGSKAWPEEAVAGLDPVSRPCWCWVPLGTLFLPVPGPQGLTSTTLNCIYRQRLPINNQRAACSAIRGVLWEEKSQTLTG